MKPRFMEQYSKNEYQQYLKYLKSDDYFDKHYKARLEHIASREKLRELSKKREVRCANIKNIHIVTRSNPDLKLSTGVPTEKPRARTRLPSNAEDMSGNDITQALVFSKNPVFRLSSQ
mmetsp:Transcript_31561/g.48247  ORF Transcript_31561/g.48247 Transcript_31561/m.48247 type:complete len:118 (+) Transcript_31561:528-881(+)